MENIKQDLLKTPEELQDVIEQVEEDQGGVTGGETKDLVEEKYYSNGLRPIVENYIPEGLQLTEAELVSLRNGMRRVSTGLRASIPINCYGDSCPFKLQCPFHKIDKAPVGKPCPVESMLMDIHTKRYLDEFEVSSENLSEVSTMSMLAATHIMEMRGFMVIGKDDEENPDGFIKNVVGFNNDDEPIIQMQEHPAWNQIDRAWRWRRNLLESLVGTRKEKYKRDAAMKERTGASPSTAAADLKSKIDKMTIIDVTEE